MSIEISTLFAEKLDKSALTPSTNDTCTAAAPECAAAIGWKRKQYAYVTALLRHSLSGFRFQAYTDAWFPAFRIRCRNRCRSRSRFRKHRVGTQAVYAVADGACAR